MRASPEAFRKLHAIFGDFARAYPGTSSAEWKEALVSLLPAFLAEAEGRPIPVSLPRESTRTMAAWRMDNLIEMCLWLGAEIGVVFKDDCK